VTQSSTDSLVERLRVTAFISGSQEEGRVMREAADRISTLERELEDARLAASVIKGMGEALAWSMDEIDILSNKMSGFAYPQGMVPARRRDQLDNYRKAVDARRSALQSEKDREGEDGR